MKPENLLNIHEVYPDIFAQLFYGAIQTEK